MSSIQTARYNAEGTQVNDFKGAAFIGAQISASRNIANNSTLTDNEKLTAINTSGLTLTIPKGGLGLNFSAMFTPPASPGSVTFAWGAGVTVNGVAGPSTAIRTRAGGVVAMTPCDVEDVWTLSGGNV